MPSQFFHRFITRPTKATLLTVLLVVNLLAAVVTLVGAYGGYVSPERSVLPALLSMMLPLLLLGGLMLMIFDLLVKRRFALIPIVAWLLALPQLLNYSPLNIASRPVPDDAKSFTFLTYNVLHFWDFRGNVPGLESNATIDYILSTDADVVNLQEVEKVDLQPSGDFNITRGQLRELRKRYPYRIVDKGNQLTLLSKYPVTCLEDAVPYDMQQKMMLYRLNIDGHEVHLFDVHLESIGLSDDDKVLYQRLFKKAPPVNEDRLKAELKEVKHRLIDKLSVAFRKRADQARFIRRTIDSIGGDFIVAGDFNDIQGCYAIRTIMDHDMHDAYARCALGPTITYHGNRFYFRIDHILYGGDLEAVDIERGDIPSSDHYPLFAKFVFTDNQP